MTDRNTTDYIASSAYDQGIADGVQKERERVRAALLTKEVANAFMDGENDWNAARKYGSDIIAGLAAALDHIGLGEESANEQ